MSGGSFNYAFAGVRQMADSIDADSPARLAFVRDLRRMADVMHAIEWEDSGDAYHADDAIALFYGRCFQHAACVQHPEIGRACFRPHRAAALARLGGRYPGLALEVEP